MALHKFEKGLDLPIPGKPVQVVRGTLPLYPRGRCWRATSPA